MDSKKWRLDCGIRGSKSSLTVFGTIYTKLRAKASRMCCAVRKVSSEDWVEGRFCADAFSVKVCVKTKVAKTATLKFKFGRGGALRSAHSLCGKA
ncbi:MAG: hypothetical protein ACKESB_03000 [Candidatus Hodgkinia cicadicola]